MLKVLEAVPNFSEGRDLEKVDRLVRRIAEYDVEVLDWSSDPDHHRSVVTFIGEPDDVEEAAVAAAAFAVRHIDLRGHRGVHPRVGALDVLPFVPLHGAEMVDAVQVARRAAERIAALGVPVWLYGAASRPPGRGLAELRRGGFEALLDGFPEGREPDFPLGLAGPHASAGVTCVGAREVLLAWNVLVGGVDVSVARSIASRIRERDGGFPGLRALGLFLERQGRVQISMNLEDPEATRPPDVFERISDAVRAAGGEIIATEVIGMLPDTLVQPGIADRLHLLDADHARVLSSRVAEFVSARAGPPTEIPDVTE
jgi:glutamate formiminotransferase